MIEIFYPPVFIKKFKKLETGLQNDAFHKIDLFKNKENHKMLDVHKLNGRFRDCFSFSINYKYRIVFRHVSKNEILFVDIGGHEIYK